jgi:hypothetical protein
MAGDPAALPTDLGDGVVVHVSRAGEDGIWGKSKQRVRAQLQRAG